LGSDEVKHNSTSAKLLTCIRLLVRHFTLDLHAADAAQLTGISHRSVITIFGKIRGRIAEECERQSPFKNGEVEVDESYFGPHRARGERGGGAGRKTVVFGLLERDGRVYTEIVPDCEKATLQAIIRGGISAGAIIHSDGWRGYNGLVDVGYAKHFRVHHGANEFVNGRSHINGIESFWSQVLTHSPVNLGRIALYPPEDSHVGQPARARASSLLSRDKRAGSGSTSGHIKG
jgi:transposase-like protein